jgi:pectin lyase
MHINTSVLAAAAATLLRSVSAVGVVGSAEGFAAGVTGGGSATPVYPSTTAELVSYLGDSSPRVIVLSKTFDFTGTEGTATETGCAPWGTASACQTAINKDDWCTNYQQAAPKVTVKYDKAGIAGIKVASYKTIIGEGSKGIIKGKGTEMVWIMPNWKILTNATIMYQASALQMAFPTSSFKISTLPT